MNPQTIIRGAVGVSLRLARLPLDTAGRLLGRDRNLTVDGADAAVRETAGRALGDEQLQAEGARLRAATDRRADAARMREHADTVTAEADAEQAERKQAAAARRKEADREARARKQEAARREKDRQAAAAERERRRKDAAAREAAQVREAAEEEAKRARLKGLDEEAAALRKRDEAATADAEAMRLQDAAERAKAERKAQTAG